jgi:hypothetical protein
MKRAGRFISAGLAALCSLSPALAQEIHFSPEERLDAIEAALIVTARISIDFASCALHGPDHSSWPSDPISSRAPEGLAGRARQ